MHISGSGPLGVLLMIAPLAAIPVFAIVGVPQFLPVAASGADADDFAELGESSSRPAVTMAPESVQPRSANDLYAPLTEAPPRRTGPNDSNSPQRRPAVSTATADRTRKPGRWLPPSEALDQWEVRTDVADTLSSSRKNEPFASSFSGTNEDEFEGLQAPADEVDDGSVSTAGFNPDLLSADRTGPSKSTGPSKTGTHSATDAPRENPPDQRAGGNTGGNTEALAHSLAEQSGWQAAARRLKKLGIRKYRLESRIDEQNFVFICTFASPANPRVVRRFEADADNPLEAVQQVLQQIDEWRNRDGAAGRPAQFSDDEN